MIRLCIHCLTPYMLLWTIATRLAWQDVRFSGSYSEHTHTHTHTHTWVYVCLYGFCICVPVFQCGHCHCQQIPTVEGSFKVVRFSIWAVWSTCSVWKTRWLQDGGAQHQYITSLCYRQQQNKDSLYKRLSPSDEHWKQGSHEGSGGCRRNRGGC